MSPVAQRDREFDRRQFSQLSDTLIRIALIGALAVLCFTILPPFLNLIV